MDIDNIDNEKEKGLTPCRESLWVMETNDGDSDIYTFESEAEVSRLTRNPSVIKARVNRLVK